MRVFIVLLHRRYRTYGYLFVRLFSLYLYHLPPVLLLFNSFTLLFAPNDLADYQVCVPTYIVGSVRVLGVSNKNASRQTGGF